MTEPSPLRPCPDRPSCVSTEATRPSQRMDPIPFAEPPVARWRASWSMLVAVMTGTVLGFAVVMAIVLGGYLTELAPPPVVCVAALALAAIAFVTGLGRSLVRTVEADAAGSLTFRTLLRRVPVAADDPLKLDPLASHLMIQSPAGLLLLTPDLARDEGLRAHLDAHPGSAAGVEGAADEADVAQAPPVLPVPRESLDASAWRIVRTSSFTFLMTLFGVGAAALMPVLWLVVLLASEGPAIRPDGSIRPLSELLTTVAITTLIPLVVVAPVVLSRIACWRTILKTGEPVPGRIDGVDRNRGEILLRYSYEAAGAGPRHRKKIVVRPTAEAKALKPGPEIVWVVPGKPRRALPQGLFVARIREAFDLEEANEHRRKRERLQVRQRSDAEW